MRTEPMSVLGGSYANSDVGSAQVRFRRAITLTLMTLVAPGSAQLIMGNKRIGRIALRIWAGTIGLCLAVLAIAVISRSMLFALMTNSTVTSSLCAALIVGALAWVGLLLDAWRLGAPRELHRRHRLTMTGVNAMVCCITAGALFFGAHILNVQNNFIGTVFASETVSASHEGRYNILLLGGDSGKDRSGLRPDSLTIASVDESSGRTVLVGLPRNLQDVPFPKGSVMREQWPDGFNCADCYLNAVNTWANDHPDLFKVKNPGIEATKGAAEAATGLKINYFALVNMKGFSSLVDAVGGVTINVQERTAIGGIGSPIRGYIEAGEKQLTGDQALWYSRSRVQNDDFSRMGRQKCVMNAMLQQLSPRTVLLNVEKIAESSKALLTTDIPAHDLPVFMDLALKARTEKVATVSLVPPTIYTGNPDFDKVHRLVGEAIDRAEGKKAAGGLLTSELKQVKPAGEATADTRSANAAEDLSKVC